MLNKKNKRGLLLAEETLKIILALIGITFLVFLLYTLYMSGDESQDLILAKGSIDNLKLQIDSEIDLIEIVGPINWYLHVWPHEYIGPLFRIPSREILYGAPISCNNMDWESCICLCNGESPESCDKEGICFENKQKFILGAKDVIKIKPVPLSFEIDYENKQIK
jgi:hypothetical protein